MTFAQEAADLISRVFGTVSPEHRIDDEEIRLAEQRLGVRLPAVLGDYYRLAGRHPQVSAGMNRLLEPSDLKVEEGALMFAIENQGVFTAGMRLDDLKRDDPTRDDPPVGELFDEHDWQPAADRLSRYLLVTFCWQACNALPAVAQADGTAEQLAAMKNALRWANFGIHSRDDTVGLWGEGVAVVVFVHVNEFYVASRDDDTLEAFGEKWGLDLSMC